MALRLRISKLGAGPSITGRCRDGRDWLGWHVVVPSTIDMHCLARSTPDNARINIRTRRAPVRGRHRHDPARQRTLGLPNHTQGLLQHDRLHLRRSRLADIVARHTVVRLRRTGLTAHALHSEGRHTTVISVRLAPVDVDGR